MSQSRRILLLLLLALALAGALVKLNRPPPRLGGALDCARAQLIDGLLRCDAEALPQLAPGDEVLGASTPSPIVRRMAPDSLAALGQAVDINHASIEELTSLPGIGPTIAARIVAGRPYVDVDALLEVKGIGPKRLAALRRRARVGDGPLTPRRTRRSSRPSDRSDSVPKEPDHAGRETRHE